MQVFNRLFTYTYIYIVGEFFYSFSFEFDLIFESIIFIKSTLFFISIKKLDKNKFLWIKLCCLYYNTFINVITTVFVICMYKNIIVCIYVFKNEIYVFRWESVSFTFVNIWNFSTLLSLKVRHREKNVECMKAITL